MNSKTRVAIILALGALLSAGAFAQQASKAPTAEIDAPPRGLHEAGAGRSPWSSDSTGGGGGDAGINPPQQRVRLPGPCEMDPGLCEAAWAPRPPLVTPTPQPPPGPGPVIPPPSDLDHCGYTPDNPFRTNPSCRPANNGYMCDGTGFPQFYECA